MHGRTRIFPALLVALGTFTFGIASPVTAQEPPPSADRGAAAIELSGGYRYLDTREEVAFSNSHGWYADVVWNAKFVGIVGEVGGGYDRRQSQVANEGLVVRSRADLTTYDAMGGVRLSGRQSAREVWFGQVLAGALRLTADLMATGTSPRSNENIVLARTETRTYPAVQFGGGVIFSPGGTLGLRVDAGMLRVFHRDEEDHEFPLAPGDGTNVYRIAAGLVLKVGRQ
jgi:hypothetical protein